MQVKHRKLDLIVVLSCGIFRLPSPLDQSKSKPYCFFVLSWLFNLKFWFSRQSCHFKWHGSSQIKSNKSISCAVKAVCRQLEWYFTLILSLPLTKFSCFSIATCEAYLHKSFPIWGSIDFIFTVSLLSLILSVVRLDMLRKYRAYSIVNVNNICKGDAYPFHNTIHICVRAAKSIISTLQVSNLFYDYSRFKSWIT